MPQYDEFGDLIPGTEEDNDEEMPAETEPPVVEDPPTQEEPPQDGPVIVGDWNLTEITEYVTYHAIDNEDFLDSDEVNKVRFLNVALRTLKRAFKGSTIPNEATYLFACVLNASFNDTTVQAQRGVASFSVDGISFTFKDWAKGELDDLITDDIAGLIDDENGDGDGGTAGRGKLKWVTL